MTRKKVREFYEKHPDSEPALKAFSKYIDKASWKSPSEVRRWNNTCKILKNNRVRFEILGNKYRVIVKIEYEFQIAYVRFIGTHAEYDKIDANTI